MLRTRRCGLGWRFQKQKHQLITERQKRQGQVFINPNARCICRVLIKIYSLTLDTLDHFLPIRHLTAQWHHHIINFRNRKKKSEQEYVESYMAEHFN